MNGSKQKHLAGISRVMNTGGKQSCSSEAIGFHVFPEEPRGNVELEYINIYWHLLKVLCGNYDVYLEQFSFLPGFRLLIIDKSPLDFSR